MYTESSSWTAELIFMKFCASDEVDFENDLGSQFNQIENVFIFIFYLNFIHLKW